MAFHQLEPAIPLHVIGKGDGYAFAAIDYGQEHNLIWVTAINDTGEIWCAPNPRVRLLSNWTMGRARHREREWHAEEPSPEDKAGAPDHGVSTGAEEDS